MTGLAARVAGLRGRRRAAAALAAGAALTLAQPPLGLWPALFVAWPVLLWLTDGATPRAAAAVGWCAGFGFFLTGLHWVGAAFLVEASKVWWYAPAMPVAVLLLAATLATFWAAGFWLARRLWTADWRRAVALAAGVLAAEVARGVVLTGFPWALQAYAWVGAPPMQAAALVGAQTLSGLTVAAAAAVGVSTRARPWPAAAAALALAAAWGWGAARLAAAPPPPPGAPVIRLVQPDVGQRDKWAPGNRRPILDNLLELTAAPPEGAPPALVVWPEVAVTFLFDESPAAVEAAVLAARAAAPGGAALAVGSVRLDRAAPGAPAFNSLLFYDAAGAPRGAYDKVRLTPFGEYVPYAWLLGALGIGTLGDGLSGFASGPGPMLVTLDDLPPFAPLICYEAIFPGAVGRAAAGADWLLQVTNDSWFGESAGPWQHLAIARARAIEQGLPLARGANTGVSAMIDPYGRLVAALGLARRGALDSPLPAPAPGRTPFARTGDGPPLAIFAIGAALLLLARAKRASSS